MGPPSRLAPPQICLDWPPPKFSKCWNHIHFARYLDVFDHEGGGAVWDSNVFLKSVTYRPTLSKFRGGQLKKPPCIYHYHTLIFLLTFGVKLSIGLIVLRAAMVLGIT